MFGELRCPGQAGRRLVELHGIGDQFAPGAVDVENLGDHSIGPQGGVVAHLPRVLGDGPLALHAVEP